ncbi:hypothetical protein GMRT_13085 [Giardia muris]|uniref:FERM domain-containing protein n=1 Tax=Giardia muris TaxID=5742 RepID=A0A4Z1T8D3_GIAMU|nr:hypothetical protein GMRT_13085 [Giardia muris]|eukprot:TNJ30383.1 hypothetical protein GMRT_13085 [Giardia muris]
MPEIEVWFCGESRRLYIQPTTTASEVVQNYFQAEALVHNEYSRFSLVCAIAGHCELVPSSSYILPWAERIGTFALWMTRPPLGQSYFDFMQMTDTFLGVLFSHAKYHVRENMWNVPPSLFSQLVAESLLAELTEAELREYLLDSDLLLGAINEYLPEDIFRILWKGKQAIQKERECVTIAHRLLSLRMVEPSDQKSRLATYMTTASTGIDAYGTVFFAGSLLSASGRVECPCAILVRDGLLQLEYMKLVSRPYCRATECMTDTLHSPHKLPQSVILLIGNPLAGMQRIKEVTLTQSAILGVHLLNDVIKLDCGFRKKSGNISLRSAASEAIMSIFGCSFTLSASTSSHLEVDHDDASKIETEVLMKPPQSPDVLTISVTDFAGRVFTPTTLSSHPPVAPPTLPLRSHLRVENIAITPPDSPY